MTSADLLCHLLVTAERLARGPLINRFLRTRSSRAVCRSKNKIPLTRMSVQRLLTCSQTQSRGLRCKHACTHTYMFRVRQLVAGHLTPQVTYPCAFKRSVFTTHQHKGDLSNTISTLLQPLFSYALLQRLT
ncbi:hypothetical protein GOODEAATRI_008153 [Goodea atripinnis]|uniref:Secreted protein n=1 Tax=Goodea atripinnis TaxID=208336 RepID=A0ABV0NSR2_9TELE